MDSPKHIENARRLGQVETGDAVVDRRERLNEGDTIRVRLRRFDPTRDEAPYFEEFQVPWSRLMRVLDVLNHIVEDQEEDLGHRWYCGTKKCGTCAVRVNGREVLACWEPAEPVMEIEPLRHAPVLRDLAVDRTAYEETVARMRPWLHRRESYSGFPEHLPHPDMERAARALDCLSCLCCHSACPVLDLGAETSFAGPAVLVQLGQQALDPRDAADRGRIAAEEASVFDCVSCYKCEEACPVEIPIVSGVIEPLKAMAYRSRPERSRHARAFMGIIERRGWIDPSGLVIATRGWAAALGSPRRVLKLLLRGKINPLKTLFGPAVRGTDTVRKLFERTKSSRS